MAGAVSIHWGTAFYVCKHPLQHAHDVGISVQEIIPIPLGVPCLEAVGLWAICQQHWNHTVEAEVYRDSWKAPHHVEGEVESTLWGKMGHLGYTSDAAPDFCVFGPEGFLCLRDNFHELSVVPELVGEEDIIGILPHLIGLCSEPPPDPLVSVHIRVEHILDASHLMGHAPSIYGLMGSSLGCDLVCRLKGGKASILLGHFCVDFMALCDQLVDLSHLVLA